MRWLPIVERLVAVLNRGKQRSEKSSAEKDVKCLDGLDGIYAGASGTELGVSSLIDKRTSTNSPRQKTKRYKRKGKTNLLFLCMPSIRMHKLLLSGRRTLRHRVVCRRGSARSYRRRS
jgi:hypothetical protein